jgi:5,10-methylenetetrahydromethanopterin reductase
LKIMITLAPDSVRSLIPRVRRCEAFAIDAIGFGDSPACQDPYVCLAVAAASTERIRLGTMVTNAVTRTAQATAQAISSVDELSGGRAFLGIGAGDSALHAAGARPLPVDSLRRSIDAIRERWRSLGGAGAKPRIVVASNGPRTIAMAARFADALATGSGVDDATIARVEDILRHAGRPEGSCERWVVARVSVAADMDAATRELRPLLASGANHVFAAASERDALPPGIRRAVDELRRRYDYGFHGRREGNPNAELVDELGLRDFLAARFALAGTSADVTRGFRRLEALGIDGVVIPAVGVDVDRLIDELGRRVLPALRATH